MNQYRVKHLEPIHIGYTNETKYALVTEDGSKFYPNDLVYQKSIDVMIQKLDEKDKELALLWFKVTPVHQGLSNKGIFYLSEKEYDYYCARSLNYLETSDSHLSGFVKIDLMRDIDQNHLYDWTRMEQYFKDLPAKFKGSVEDKKIRKNWKSRTTPDGKGVHGSEMLRAMTMVKLTRMNVERGEEMMNNLREYQKLNWGRKVILRMMCDRRVEDYNQWEMCCEEIMEACSSILEEEGRLKLNSRSLQTWNTHNHRTNPGFASVTEFKKLLATLRIRMTRFVLVPDVHFIRQWIELPLRVDYTCAIVLRPDGKEYYRPIQAQLHVFERLACDIDWKTAMTKNREKAEQMRSKIIELMKKCQKKDLYSTEVIENSINEINSDNFFSESRKRAMNTPLYICRKKTYNDMMPMSQFKKLFEAHCHELTMAYQDDFWKLDEFEIWKVRYFFLLRWIDMMLSDHEQLTNNLKAALTMQIGFMHHNYVEDLDVLRTKNAMDSFVVYSKIRMFEEMAEKSGIKKVEGPKQNVPQVHLSPKRNQTMKKPIKQRILKTSVRVSPKKTSESTGKVDEPMIFQRLSSEAEELKKTPSKHEIVANVKERQTCEENKTKMLNEKAVAKAKECQKCVEKEKKFNDEINILNQQLTDQSKLLEDQGNRLQSDAMQIHNLQKELREARGAMAKREEDAKVMENSLKVQATKIKQDYKASKTEIHELNEKLREKDKNIKQLETQLKEIRETVKNEQKKKNSKEDEQSKAADENLKKIKAELERAKLTEKANSKTIEDLTKKHRGLEIELEIMGEQRGTTSIDSEKDERFRELTQECEDLKMGRIGMLADIQELSARNRDLENQLSLEVGTKPSTSSPFAELQNHLEDKENIRDLPSSSSLQNSENHVGVRHCLICTSKIENSYQDVPKCEQCRNEFHNHCISKWLGVNPTCPACRKRWLDPEEYPEL